MFAPWTASSSAFSFPRMSEWPFTHSSIVIFGLVLRALTVALMISPIGECI